MGRLVIPPEYSAHLKVREVEIAIKDIKDFFQRNLAEALGLVRVSAPLFVRSGT
ncbi:MAG: aspartate--ammonia ligase, partial [Proteobacteria bacterium]|nr:aspartate--ammonia ligase [Pseudomonadota bacterium]